MKKTTRAIALASAAAIVAALATSSYALMNVWACQAGGGGYYCWVAGTIG